MGNMNALKTLLNGVKSYVDNKVTSNARYFAYSIDDVTKMQPPNYEPLYEVDDPVSRKPRVKPVTRDEFIKAYGEHPVFIVEHGGVRPVLYLDAHDFGQGTITFFCYSNDFSSREINTGVRWSS